MFDKIKEYFNPAPKVVFTPMFPGLETFMPIIPAREYKPRWMDLARADFAAELGKGYPAKRLVSIHKCPGIISMFNTGWILRAWQDFSIITDGDGESFRWQAPVNLVKYRQSPDIDDMVAKRMPLRENTLKTIIKFNSPWFVDMPRGWNLMFMPMMYSDDTRFTSAPGILDPDIDSGLHVQLYWHRLNSVETIRAGTPLVHLIPVKKDSRLDYEIAEYSKEVEERQFRQGYNLFATNVINYKTKDND